MSGLQEVAAIVGIAEVSFRSILSLYEFVRELKHVPKEIERLRSEMSILTRSLSALSSFLVADSDAQSICQKIGLQEAIARCSEACRSLQEDLERWILPGGRTLRTKIQFRLHRKAIDAVLAQISFAKQTTILSVVVTQLSVQHL